MVGATLAAGCNGGGNKSSGTANPPGSGASPPPAAQSAGGIWHGLPAANESITFYIAEAGDLIVQTSPGITQCRSGRKRIRSTSTRAAWSSACSTTVPTCTVNGQVQIIDARFNLYRFEIQLSLCQGLSGPVFEGTIFRGLAARNLPGMPPGAFILLLTGAASGPIQLFSLLYERV